MMKRKGYIFTNKDHTQKGIMSTILGILAIITLSAAVYLSYLKQGNIPERYGAAGFLAAVFMSVGGVLGVLSTGEKDKFKMFSVIGIVVNLAAFLMLSLIFYAGAYVE